MTIRTDEFDPKVLIGALERFPTALRSLVGDRAEADTEHTSAPEHWSARAVVLHLLLEERVDFRPRLRATLERPGALWDPIDPEGDVRRELAQAPPIDELLDRFEAERRESVAWLRALGDPNWDAAYEHPTFGPILAADLLVSWAAHDLLHARQIVKRLYERTVALGGGYDALYAGAWTS